MVNAHSHAFQRDLRGVAELPVPEAHRADDFWSWREAMYALAGRLDPEGMEAVGRRVYAEMRAAGYGAVGEFHYVHHRPEGTPYEEPNAMTHALARAAAAEGLPIVLIPAAYHRAGWDGGDRPPAPGQRRFCDPSAEAFLERVDALRRWAADRPGVSVAVAAHSLRAVPFAWLEAIADYSEAHGLPRHVHVAEQRRELEEVRAEHGASPIEVLERAGFLGPSASLVHAIHVTDADIARIATHDAVVVACPTTEGNLGDGHQPALRWRDAGVRVAVGSDSQVRVDPFEEARELETGARREGQTRFGLMAAAGDLWGALTAAGAESLGLDPAALPEVEIDAEHPSLAGCPPETLPQALVASGSAAVVRPPPG